MIAQHHHRDVVEVPVVALVGELRVRQGHVCGQELRTGQAGLTPVIATVEEVAPARQRVHVADGEDHRLAAVGQPGNVLIGQEARVPVQIDDVYVRDHLLQFRLRHAVGVDREDSVVLTQERIFGMYIVSHARHSSADRRSSGNGLPTLD
ncbi:hypothetical protein D3C87_1392440 [compost metagenome]